MKHLISSGIVLSIILMLAFSSINVNIISEEESLGIEEKSEAQYLGQVDTLATNTYYDVPLSHELQDYVREICEEYDVDMEIILGIMKTESDFRHNVSSKNNIGGGRSVGVTQLNENYIDWYGELTELCEGFDINNIHHNILGGVLVYKFYKDYWERQGYEGDELIIHSLNSYNMGIQGFKNYKRKYNAISRSYDKKVLNYKNNLTKKEKLLMMI